MYNAKLRAQAAQLLYITTNTAVQKITGNGLYLGKTPGSGLYLKRGKAPPVGTVYQMPTESLVAGDGLLLGPNSPFKNVPFLNVIL